jgi:hypothetical protein
MSVRTVLTLLLAPLVAVLASCGDAVPTDRGPDSTVPSRGQTTFPAAEKRVPDGYVEELCPDLRRESSGLAIRLVVPEDYRLRAEKHHAGCYFSADLDRDFGVSMNTHQTVKTFQEKSVSPNDGYEGDDGVGDIVYHPDRAVYGERRGEVLTWGSNNDGLPLDNRVLQADGVRLSWHTPQGQAARWADELAAITASIAVVETRRDTCTADGATTTYVVPRQTDSVDAYGGYCYLYLRPRDSLLRYAQIDPHPERSVEALAAQLPGRRHVESVRLEPGAATLLGEPADRLTWVVVRPHRTWDGPRGTWRIVMIARDDLQVSWGATPAQWRQEGADFDAFVASVLSPGRPSRS